MSSVRQWQGDRTGRAMAALAQFCADRRERRHVQPALGSVLAVQVQADEQSATIATAAGAGATAAGAGAIAAGTRRADIGSATAAQEPTPGFSADQGRCSVGAESKQRDQKGGQVSARCFRQATEA